MSKTFNSWSALKSALQKEVASAMEETATKSFMDVHKNVDAFYSIGGGGAYQRTGQGAFWRKTKEDVKKNIKESFGKRFD